MATLPLVGAASGLQFRLKVLRKKESAAGPVGKGTVGLEVVVRESASPEKSGLFIGLLSII